MKTKNSINKSGTTKFGTKKTIIIIVLILAVLGIVGIVVYVVLKNKTHSTPTHNPKTTKPKPTPPPIPPTPTPKPEPPSPDPGTDWLANLYKTLNWANQPINANPNASTVSTAWQQWAKQNSNAILQYYVNYRMNTQGVNCYDASRDFWPTSNIEFNPVYTWEGLVSAVKLWNNIVRLNYNSANKPLGNLTGFCDESDINLRLMTLAAFLGNATVESAYFMVCKESIVLATNPPVNCPGNAGDTTSPKRYNSRYCNNCDNSNPSTYSCEGTPSQPTITCNAATKTCGSCTGCCAGNLCNTGFDKAGCAAHSDYFWCDGPTTTTKQDNFNPAQDPCTGGWPKCEAGEDFPFKFDSISTDPCMTDPHADGSKRDTLDNTKPNCSDWNGNSWQQQQQCYFGRGLIQLTWSCNYYKVQAIFTKMAQLLKSTGAKDSLSTLFISTMEAKFDSDNSGNICAKPDSLCGDYKLNGNQVVYSSNLIKQAIPWLSCIAYWSFGVTKKWTVCYSFEAAYDGIAPSGAGDKPDRLIAYLQLLKVMGVPSKYYQVSYVNKVISNICLSTSIRSTCDTCSSGGSAGYACGTSYSDAMQNCSDKTKSCLHQEDCAKFNIKTQPTNGCYTGCSS